MSLPLKKPQKLIIYTKTLNSFLEYPNNYWLDIIKFSHSININLTELINAFGNLGIQVPEKYQKIYLPEIPKKDKIISPLEFAKFELTRNYPARYFLLTKFPITEPTYCNNNGKLLLPKNTYFGYCNTFTKKYCMYDYFLKKSFLIDLDLNLNTWYSITDFHENKGMPMFPMFSMFSEFSSYFSNTLCCRVLNKKF